jgi:hypothetical protein
MSETIRYRPWAEPGRRDVRAELDRAPRAGWRELNDPETVIEAKIGVEPPTEPLVELFRAVNIRDGDDDNLELHVHNLNSSLTDDCRCRDDLIVPAMYALRTAYVGPPGETGLSRSELVDINDGFGKGLRGFLWKIVPDAAGDEPVIIASSDGRRNTLLKFTRRSLKS